MNPSNPKSPVIIAKSFYFVLLKKLSKAIEKKPIIAYRPHIKKGNYGALKM